MPERAVNRDISPGQPPGQPGQDKRDIPYSHVPFVPPYGRDKADKCPDCPATLDPVAEIPTEHRYGPWAANLTAAERLARLRALRAITRLTTGPRGERLADLLHRAERDPAALVPALAALNRLASLDRRAVLASFAALHRTAA